MKRKVNKEVQEQIERYRKTGKDYFNPKDKDMDFSKCDEKPKDTKNTK